MTHVFPPKSHFLPFFLHIFFFFFFLTTYIAYRISVPQPGTEPGSQQWKPGILTIRQPGNSLNHRILSEISIRIILNSLKYTFLGHCRLDQKLLGWAREATFLRNRPREFPGGPVVRTLNSHYQGPCSPSVWGNEIYRLCVLDPKQKQSYTFWHLLKFENHCSRWFSTQNPFRVVAGRMVDLFRVFRIHLTTSEVPTLATLCHQAHHIKWHCTKTHLSWAHSMIPPSSPKSPLWSWVLASKDTGSSNTLLAWILSHFICVQLCANLLWTVALQAPLSIGFSRQEYWSGLPCPPPGDLYGPRIKPVSLTSPALLGGFFTTSTTWEAQYTSSYAGLSLVSQLCSTLCDPMNCSPPGSSVHGDSLGKNTGAGCDALFQGIVPTQGSYPGLPHCR